MYSATTLMKAGLFNKSSVLKRHEILKRPFTVDTNIYLINEGALKIYVLNDDNEQIIRLAYPGNLIVSLDSYIDEKPSPFIIEAIKKSEILICDKTRSKAYINSSFEHLQAYTQLLEQLILQQVEREHDLLLSSPKERYLKVLDRSPQLFQYIPHKYIANYLRMSPETLSRLKKC